jgi:hypothetical protein
MDIGHRFDFSPGSVEIFSGVSTDVQRDWRRRGFLSNYGMQLESGRWVYSLRDTGAFWLATRLMKTGCELRFACDLAWTHLPTFLDILRGKGKTRFVAVLHDEDAEGLGGRELVGFSSWQELEGRNFHKAEVIDLRRIAETAPDHIRRGLLDYAPSASGYTKD